MSVNLVKTIQENLCFLPLHKINHNTEQHETDHAEIEANKFSHAAFTAVHKSIFHLLND